MAASFVIFSIDDKVTPNPKPPLSSDIPGKTRNQSSTPSILSIDCRLQETPLYMSGWHKYKSTYSLISCGPTTDMIESDAIRQIQLEGNWGRKLGTNITSSAIGILNSENKEGKNAATSSIGFTGDFTPCHDTGNRKATDCQR